MSDTKEILNKIFSHTRLVNNEEYDKRYEKIGLKFNPFPRSGTTNINGSDTYNERLIPFNEGVKNMLYDFISMSLQENALDKKDKFISATITGNYGAGKTQLLMYAKYLLGLVATYKEYQKNPYVIYIDNPGASLLELIGTIISKIGEENFKKSIWNKIIKIITNSDIYKGQLSKFVTTGSALFPNINPDPYSKENSVSYKKFLAAFTTYINNVKVKKDFEDIFKNILIDILDKDTKDATLSKYFYDLIADDYGVNKTWEALSSGTIKHLDKKEAQIIQYIVKLIKEQGYTDFFILVDEFEDITEGRLTKAQLDNYIYNLRTLLDEHREWCLLFAMTGNALKKLKDVSPPLADRITNRLIKLQDLNHDEAKVITLNYLNLAKEIDSKELVPFDESGINQLNELVEGNARKYLKDSYFIIEKAINLLDEGNMIDSTFITQHYPKDSL